MTGTADMEGHQVDAADGGASHLSNAPQGFRDESMRASAWDRMHHLKHQALKRMDTICGQLHFSYEDKEQAKSLLEAFVKNKWHQNRRLDLACGACAFLRCKLAGKALSLIEVASSINVSKEELYAEYTKLRAVVIAPGADGARAVVTAIEPEPDASTAPGQSSNEQLYKSRSEDLPFVHKYVQGLDLPNMSPELRKRVQRIAENIFALAKADQLLSGRNPLTFVVGCITLASNALGFSLDDTLHQLLQATGASRTTVSARMADMRRSVLSLAQQLPWGQLVTLANVDVHMAAAMENPDFVRQVAESQERKRKLDESEREGEHNAASDKPRVRGPPPRNYFKAQQDRERRTAKLARAKLRLALMRSSALAGGLKLPPVGSVHLAPLVPPGAGAPSKRQRTALARDVSQAAPLADAPNVPMDEEDIQILLQLRRGVPEEAIITGYFDAVPTDESLRDPTLDLLDPLVGENESELFRSQAEVEVLQRIARRASAEAEKAAANADLPGQEPEASNLEADE